MDKMNNLTESVIFPRGEKAPEAVAKYFVGTNYLNMLVPFDSPLKCPIGNVTFEPGCRNNWHKHPGGKSFWLQVAEDGIRKKENLPKHYIQVM